MDRITRRGRTAELAMIAVDLERDRQDDKWGMQDHEPEVWLSILMEEVGEAANAMLSMRFDPTTQREKDYRTELVQVAAVTVAMIECWDRKQRSREGK